jgi:hypothetical protein
VCRICNQREYRVQARPRAPALRPPAAASPFALAARVAGSPSSVIPLADKGTPAAPTDHANSPRLAAAIHAPPHAGVPSEKRDSNINNSTSMNSNYPNLHNDNNKHTVRPPVGRKDLHSATKSDKKSRKGEADPAFRAFKRDRRRDETGFSCEAEPPGGFFADPRASEPRACGSLSLSPRLARPARTRTTDSELDTPFACRNFKTISEGTSGGLAVCDENSFGFSTPRRPGAALPLPFRSEACDATGAHEAGNGGGQERRGFAAFLMTKRNTR